MSLSLLSIGELRRRTVRAQLNPLDKSTVVSIYPKAIREVKPTTNPSVYELAAGSYEKPSVLVVTSASWWKELDENQPLLEITNHSVQVAEAVVRDYCNGLLCCSVGSIQPGLFWIPGEKTVAEVQKDHKALLDKAKAQQTAWYEALVHKADAEWAKTNGSPFVISDDMRMAARILGLDNKNWMENFSAVNMQRCKACGSLRNPEFPICPTCKFIDPTHPMSKDLKFAVQ